MQHPQRRACMCKNSVYQQALKRQLVCRCRTHQWRIYTWTEKVGKTTASHGLQALHPRLSKFSYTGNCCECSRPGQIPAQHKDSAAISTKGWRDLTKKEVNKLKDGAMRKPHQDLEDDDAIEEDQSKSGEEVPHEQNMSDIPATPFRRPWRRLYWSG